VTVAWLMPPATTPGVVMVTSGPVPVRLAFQPALGMTRAGNGRTNTLSWRDGAGNLGTDRARWRANPHLVPAAGAGRGHGLRRSGNRTQATDTPMHATSDPFDAPLVTRITNRSRSVTVTSEPCRQVDVVVR